MVASRSPSSRSQDDLLPIPVDLGGRPARLDHELQRRRVFGPGRGRPMQREAHRVAPLCHLVLIVGQLDRAALGELRRRWKRLELVFGAAPAGFVSLVRCGVSRQALARIPQQVGRRAALRPEHRGSSGNPRAPRFVREWSGHHGRFAAIMGDPRPSWAIRGPHGQSAAIMGNPRHTPAPRAPSSATRTARRRQV